MAVLDQPLERVAEPTGVIAPGWATTLDHKQIGLLYIVTSLVFMAVGGLEAMVIRAQLWVPDAHVVGPDTFNQLFTMHGTTMIFFVVMPMLFGFGNYLVPLMIGARDMAFPRLNAFSYWMFALGGALTYMSFFAGGTRTWAGSLMPP